MNEFMISDAPVDALYALLKVVITLKKLLEEFCQLLYTLRPA